MDRNNSFGSYFNQPRLTLLTSRLVTFDHPTRLQSSTPNHSHTCDSNRSTESTCRKSDPAARTVFEFAHILRYRLQQITSLAPLIGSDQPSSEPELGLGRNCKIKYKSSAFPPRLKTVSVEPFQSNFRKDWPGCDHLAKNSREPLF